MIFSCIIAVQGLALPCVGPRRQKQWSFSEALAFVDVTFVAYLSFPRLKRSSMLEECHLAKSTEQSRVHWYSCVWLILLLENQGIAIDSCTCRQSWHVVAVATSQSKLRAFDRSLCVSVIGT